MDLDQHRNRGGHLYRHCEMDSAAPELADRNSGFRQAGMATGPERGQNHQNGMGKGQQGGCLIFPSWAFDEGSGEED